MKFPIQNIEANLNENILLIGETILDRSRPDVVKLDGNLWISNIDQFEIEVQLVADKVRAYSCECPSFDESGVCGHIAAVLFVLRRKLTATREEVKKKRKKSSQNLSVNQILRATPPDELQAFIRQYARKNRLFGIALKVRFAAGIPYDDNETKYNELLDTVFKHLTSRQDTISAQGVRHLSGFVEMLNNQADDAIALQHYTEAYDLLNVLISRLLNIIRKCPQNIEELSRSTAKTCDKLKLLAGKELSPDMKSQVWEFAKSKFHKRAARQLGIAGSLLGIALGLSDERGKMTQLLQAVGTEFKKQHSIEHKLELANCVIPFLPASSASQHVFEGIIREQTDYLLLMRLSEMLMLSSMPKESMLAANQAFEAGLPVDLHFSLRKTMLTASEQLNSPDDIFENSLWLFHETGSSEYYKSCQSVITDVSNDRIAKVENEIQFSTDDFLSLSLLALRQNWSGLLNVLGEKSNINVLIKFAAPLYETRPEETRKLFEAHFERYLKTHFGPVPARQLATWLREIERNCNQSLAGNLRAFLRKNYPGKLKKEVAF